MELAEVGRREVGERDDVDLERREDREEVQRRELDEHGVVVVDHDVEEELEEVDRGQDEVPARSSEIDSGRSGAPSRSSERSTVDRMGIPEPGA